MNIQNDRRNLHRIPELDRDLPKTTAYLKNALSTLRCTVSSPIKGAVCAYFDFGADDAIAFRSDADALPISEKTGAEYASLHPACMHACGHDGHMAILLELARRLDSSTDIRHNILLIFQPAEETNGGAADICSSGIFEKHNVKCIFGMHLWPDIPKGKIASRSGEMMSRSCELTVDIYGKSSHIAKCEQGIDALAAGVNFYNQVDALEKKLPDNVFRLCKFGKMESGIVRNAVSAKTHLEGCLRAFHDETFDFLSNGIKQIGANIEKSTGCKVCIHMNSGYPAVMNDPVLYNKISSICGDLFYELDKPAMITEDFSFYQKHLPGVFFFLGTGPSPALHADNFDFDESVLSIGADFFTAIASRF